MPPFSSLPDPGAISAAACRVTFNAAASGRRDGEQAPQLAVALPVLAGEPCEILLEAADRVSTHDTCTLFHGDGALAGFALAPVEMDLETATLELYRRVFEASQGQRLYRIWNYIPQINAVEQGLENYRRFCRGRSLAFERHFGCAFQAQLPAASAVGTVGRPLAVAFLAGELPARHFENPRQVPAFEYPPDYGPRPPSFSRATLVETDAQRRLFISGTAAIRGHATVAPEDLSAQLACTVENLNLIADTAGAGAQCGAARGWRRSFKVYLRHRAEFAAIRHFLDRHLLQPRDQALYVLADLCRADLRVEIEAVLTAEA